MGMLDEELVAQVNEAREAVGLVNAVGLPRDDPRDDPLRRDPPRHGLLRNPDPPRFDPELWHLLYQRVVSDWPIGLLIFVALMVNMSLLRREGLRAGQWLFAEFVNNCLAVVWIAVCFCLSYGFFSGRLQQNRDRLLRRDFWN